MTKVPSPEDQARDVLQSSRLVARHGRRLRVPELLMTGAVIWWGLHHGWGWWTLLAGIGVNLFTGFVYGLAVACYREGAKLRAEAKAVLDRAEATSPAPAPGTGEVWIIRTSMDTYAWRVKTVSGGQAEGWAVTVDRARNKCIRAQRRMAKAGRRG